MAQAAQQENESNEEDKVAKIEGLLQAEFEPSHMEVINEAHSVMMCLLAHRFGNISFIRMLVVFGWNVQCDNMKIKVIIVSDKFKGVQLIDRHRNVQQALGVNVSCFSSLNRMFF